MDAGIDGRMDRRTDAWRAGWRGRVVNGVRREALTDRCGQWGRRMQVRGGRRGMDG